jgi:hypothetical protein
VDTLRLSVEHKEPEDRDEASPTGFVSVEHGAHRAVLLVPDEIDPRTRYPLFTVLHGAGRQDETLAKLFRDRRPRLALRRVFGPLAGFRSAGFRAAQRGAPPLAADLGHDCQMNAYDVRRPGDIT